jgi:hypothetical protein
MCANCIKETKKMFSAEIEKKFQKKLWKINNKEQLAKLIVKGQMAYTDILIFNDEGDYRAFGISLGILKLIKHINYNKVLYMPDGITIRRKAEKGILRDLEEFEKNVNKTDIKSQTKV